MHLIKGTSVFGGIAIGKLVFFRRRENEVKRTKVEDTEKEIERLNAAIETAITQLQELYDKALTNVGEVNAQIFDIHQMMLQDGDYLDSIHNMISTQKINAEYAVARTGSNFSKMFSEMDDAYMRERAADVKDISERVIRILGGADDYGLVFDRPVVLAADDLAPSETVQLDKSKILAFITMHGSTNSHTAILARMMNIPAIVGMGDALKLEYDGIDVIVDGTAGEVYVEPDEEQRKLFLKKAADEAEKRRLLEQLRGKENVTKDGIKIDIYANIGGVADVAAALQNDAGGIGLFRSEFLYLGSNDYPDENKQFESYRAVAENMAGKRVIIRTLDIGADKQIDYFELPKEENPAMGFRAIRICLERPELFKTQLRALYRASAFGKIAIMFPMITSVDEVKEIKAIANKVMLGLDADGILYDKDIELGVMIETPAAVIISDELAAEVDFFSIGTNDLTQYTLAVDRQNPKLSRFYNPHHKALLRMIKMVVDNAHKQNKWVGICGELASDLELTEYFLSIGVDELSVSPPFILPLRDKVRNTNR